MQGAEGFFGEVKMNCEEFAIAGLDRNLDAGGVDTGDARAHLRDCPHCAALYESLLALRSDLRELAQLTSEATAPSRVEMRLRQEFRTRNTTEKSRGRAVVASWLLAAATLVLVATSLVLWQRHGLVNTVKTQKPSETPAAVRSVATGPELGGTLIAENDGDEFALIPGAIPGMLDDTTVVRVQMERGSLGALGLSVNEEHANDVVQVDLLLGADGQPQAYRLPQSSD
jgi:predicted anti-sigma-YlaC factor YlaD